MRAGEYGVQLQIATQFELGSATAAELWIKKPDKTVLVRALNVAGWSGQSTTYTTVAADFAAQGMYELQLAVDWGASKHLISQKALVAVDAALQ